jgi:hypothetical protein
MLTQVKTHQMATTKKGPGTKVTNRAHSKASAHEYCTALDESSKKLGCLMSFKWPQTKPADVSWFQKKLRAHLHIDAQKSSLARQI